MRSARMLLLLGLLTTVMIACPGPSKSRIEEPEHFIAWDAILPTLSPTPAKSIGVPAGTKACTAAMLRVGSFGIGGAAAGTYYTSAGVRNVTDEACFVHRRSTARFVDERGREVQAPMRVGLEPDSGVLIPPGTDQKPGSALAYPATIRLGISNVCPPLPASTMEIAFGPVGSRRRVDLPSGLGSAEPQPDCGVPPGRGSYLVDFVAEAPPEPEPAPSPLVAKIRTYERARLGTRFRYFVELINPTSEAVSLEPCPLYNESTKSAGNLETYVLNCEAVPSIAARSSVFFEMFIDMPASTDAVDDGRILLTWGFDGSAGPSTHAWIELR